MFTIILSRIADKESVRVYSNKIGFSCFRKTVIAAYVLQGLYTDGAALVAVNADFAFDEVYVGWLNYILDEHFFALNVDVWRAFEMMHRLKNEIPEMRYDLRDIMGTGTSFDNRFEVLYVCSADETSFRPEKIREEILDSYDKSMTLTDYIIRQKQILRKYRETSDLPEEEQPDFLLNMFRKYFESGDIELKEAGYNDKLLMSVRRCISFYGLPAIIIKDIADLYGIDFWELWERISHVANKWRRVTADGEIPPVRTEKLFRIDADDLIFFWSREKPVRFSEEAEKWFEELREKFDRLVGQDFSFENPVRRIVDILYDAEEIYWHIYAFDCFFNETMDHIGDGRYHAVWAIFDEMVQ